MRTLTFEQAKEKIADLTGLELLDYHGSQEPSNFHCKKCDGTFTSLFHNVRVNKSCQSCKKIDYKKHIGQKAIEIHGDAYTYTNIPDSSYGAFEYVCNTCNGTHKQNVHNHIAAQQGCPRCCKPTGGLGRVVPQTFLAKPQLANKPATFYIVKMMPRDGGEHFYKYGVTTIKLATRLANVMFHSQCNTEVVFKEKGRYIDMFFLETQFGLKIEPYTTPHKWLGSGECFKNEWKPILEKCGHDLNSGKTRAFLDELMEEMIKVHGVKAV